MSDDAAGAGSLPPAAWIGAPVVEFAEVSAPVANDVPFETWGLFPPTCLRRGFQASGVRAAFLTITSLGLHECWVNGSRVGDDVLAPGWTDYHRRVHTSRVDVTDLLVEGANAVAAVVADGWYAGFVGYDRGHQARQWGERPRLLAWLDLQTDSGPLRVGTDEHWRRSTGAVRYADLLMGEMHDARQEPPGWRLAGFDDSEWLPVAVEHRGSHRATLAPSPAPPMRVTATLPAVSVTPSGPDSWLVDFGQYLVGHVELDVAAAAAGDRIHLRHGEALDDDGALYVANLRTALAHDIYVCSGEPDQVFAPRFTFHGFRYAEISGYPGTLSPAAVRAKVVHSDVERVGRFGCGEPLVTRLHDNIVWTIRGNLLDVPTDCPQRDERLGWLADAQLISPTANHLFDLDGFFTKWTQDVEDAQASDGSFPDVAPRVGAHVPGAPGWADAGVLVPWQTYLHSGHDRILRERYPSMRRWLDAVVSDNPGLVRRHGLGRNFGDWLSLDAPTDKTLLATAYLALCAETMAHTAAALHRPEDAAGYDELWHAIRAAFAGEFVESDGRLAGRTQTAYAMALHLDLVPEHLRAGAAAHLVEDIEERSLTTGIHGTRFVCPALSDVGRSDVAYDLLLRRGYPSWMHSIECGATTVWERWDGWTPHAGFQTPTMNSFNHYALGSVAEWLHRYAAGMTPLRPGYAEVLVRPFPSARLGHVTCERRVAGGRLLVHWEVVGDQAVALRLEVPAGVTAVLSTFDPDGGWREQRIGPGALDQELAWSPSWRTDDIRPPGRLPVRDARRP